MLQTVIQPIIFAGKTDEHPGRLAVSCYDNLLRLRFVEEAREIIFNFGECNLLKT